MRLEHAGKIIDDFYVTGNPAMPVYLLDGPVPALFDAGLTSLCRLYEEDIAKVLGNRSPAYLFLTHSHFDHIGAAAYLKTVYPEMRIAGSARTQEILGRPKAIELIRSLNQEAAQLMESLNRVSIYKGPFEPFDLDLKLNSDHTIELNPDRHVEVIKTPGHTRDFTSYWVPEKKILIASEAVGCDDGSGYIYTEFLVDYDSYLTSLKRLSQLDVQVLCQGHRLVFTGKDAQEHMHRSLEQAPKYLFMVEEFLQKEQGDIDRTVARVKAVEWDPKPWPKQIESAYVLNTQARVSNIRERMQQKRREG
ncbi:MAG: MBL fold metallo-hydrolase [Deltaproteobacteria bacterium]|nr:MBL fold metallo-hydrolase [Deltaproteobacteria bacterium]MBW2345546.1 MBL fold metallo-hydrolase [Deltaproteobacteria bacterium]